MDCGINIIIISAKSGTSVITTEIRIRNIRPGDLEMFERHQLRYTSERREKSLARRNRKWTKPLIWKILSSCGQIITTVRSHEILQTLLLLLNYWFLCSGPTSKKCSVRVRTEKGHSHS